jgi:hypothetical protein
MRLGPSEPRFKVLRRNLVPYSPRQKKILKRLSRHASDPRLELLEDPRLKEELIQRNTRLQANPNRVELAKRVLTEYDPNLAGEPDPVGKLKLLLLDTRSVAVLKKLQTAFEKAGVTP